MKGLRPITEGDLVREKHTTYKYRVMEVIISESGFLYECKRVDCERYNLLTENQIERCD